MTKEKWIKLGARNLSPLTWSGIMNSLREGTKIKKLSFYLLKYLAIFYGKPPSIDFEYSEVYFKTNFKELIIEKNEELDKILIKISNTIEKDLKLLPTSKKEDLLEFYNSYKKQCGFMYKGYYINQIVIEQLKNVLEEKEFEKIKLNLTIPHKITMISKEHYALEEVREKYHKGLIEDEKLVEETQKLVEDFGFIHSEYCAKEWKAEDYILEIKRKFVEKKQQNLQHEIPKHEDEYVNWLISVIRKTSYMFDESKSALVRANWALRNTLTNLGFDEEEIMSCFEKEFLYWLETGNLPENLMKRKSYFALILDENKFKEVFGKKKVDKIIKEEGITEFEEFTEELNEIKGTIAFEGKVIGRVKITHTQQDANKLKEGEILVTGMTTPELLAGMRKAAAFITDEGGLLCHAAIVAREIKKPCIIGTKIATKVLNDGDLVEVNANKGVVKVLKKN